LEILSPCVYINKKEGEKLRKFLLNYKFLEKEKKIKVKDDNIFFPLNKNLEDSERTIITQEFKTANFTNEKFILKKKSESSKLIDILSKHFSNSEKKFIPKSFDIIGKIAIIEIPIEIQTKEDLLANLLLRYNKSLKSVFSKVGKVNGEYRLRELKFLAGKCNTVTIHKENGCRYELDVKKVYFSPRLVTEHARIANMVKSNELVLDMFAGIGPFSILIAKRTGATVYSIDKNPDAVSFLKKNLRLNKVENLVIPFFGDVSELIPKKIKEKFDRIIMNLPEIAINYLQIACESLNPRGGIIHLYIFKTESESYEEIEEKIYSKINNFGRSILSINIRKVKSTAPHEWQLCFDIRIN